MFNLQKITCKHDYEYSDKEREKDVFPFLVQKSQNYIFSCKKCKDVKVINNYSVLRTIQDTFVKLLDAELGKPQDKRMSSSDLKDKAWDNYSRYSSINDGLRDNINVYTIGLESELSEITMKDIWALDVYVTGTKISGDFLDRSLESDCQYILAMNKRKKFILIDSLKFITDIDKKEEELKSKYLRKGIHKNYVELRKEALIRMSKLYGIVCK